MRSAKASWVVALLCLQGIFLLSTCQRLPNGYDQRSQLEERPRPPSGTPPPLKASAIVDHLHVLGGEDPNELGVEVSERRQRLPNDTGTFLWVSVSEQLRGPCILSRLFESQARRGRTIGPLRPLTSEQKVVNLCFNAGGSAYNFAQAWASVVYPELQQTDLLPWNRSLDVVIVSSYSQRAAGGLLHLAQVAPDTPVLAPPPHPDDASQASILSEHLHNLMQLPVGYTPLTPRMAAFVYEGPPVPDIDVASDDTATQNRRHYNLVLLVRSARYINVLNGSEGLPPHELLGRLRRYIGKGEVRFVGTTGYRIGDHDTALEANLLAASRLMPGLAFLAGGDTSQAAHGLLRRVLGKRAGMLIRGESIEL